MSGVAASAAARASGRAGRGGPASSACPSVGSVEVRVSGWSTCHTDT